MSCILYLLSIAMSVSPKQSACTLLDLHCNEATSDVVYLDSNIHNNNYESNDTGSSNALLWIDNSGVDEEERLLSLFDSEHDHVQERTRLLVQLRKTKWLRNAREEAINWILKVCAYYSFRPETAYVSAIYLDRFLLSRTLKQDKTWPLQLLSVACLSLAAKMEETKVPLLLDLQMVESRFFFKPKTVQRMELLVMATLKWRLRVITNPFDFAHLFIARLSCSAFTLRDLNYVASRVSDVIIKTCFVTDFLEISPSTIAAAALLYVTDQYVDDLKLYRFHKNITIDMVHKCYNLMKKTIQRSEYFLPKTSTLQIMPLSPTCVLDLADLQDSHSATHK